MIKVPSEVDGLDVDGVVFVQDPKCSDRFTLGEEYVLRDASETPDDPWWRLGGPRVEIGAVSPEKCVVIARELGASLRAAFGDAE